MASVTLPSSFGGHITLSVGHVASARHSFENPRHHFSAQLDGFVVNGKPYASLTYDFYIEQGKTSIRHTDWRAYVAGSSSRVEMTDKGRSKVREAIEAAVLAFLASEEGVALLKRADAEQRAELVAKCNNQIEALRQSILAVEALKVEAVNPEFPVYETADKLRRI